MLSLPKFLALHLLVPVSIYLLPFFIYTAQMTISYLKLHTVQTGRITEHSHLDNRRCQACVPQVQTHFFDQKRLRVARVPQRLEERTHLAGAITVIKLYVCPLDLCLVN